MQNDLGADIIMAFDECPAADAPLEYHRAAVERTMRWAEQCLAAHGRPGEQSLVRHRAGGRDLEAASRNVRGELIEMDFPGYAIGGLGGGGGFEAMKTVLAADAGAARRIKPRYLMGVGFPRDIVAAVASGMDMFDCVLPTRNGRNALCVYGGWADSAAEQRCISADPGPIEAGMRLLCLPEFYPRGDPALFFRGRDAWPGAGFRA